MLIVVFSTVKYNWDGANLGNSFLLVVSIKNNAIIRVVVILLTFRYTVDIMIRIQKDLGVLFR